MLFTVRNNIANYSFMQYIILLDAKTIILSHNVTPGESKLNNYLLANYNADLRLTCLHLLKNCKMYKNLSNEIVIIFPKKEDNKLAELITYGNNEMQGSSLLKKAFFRE